ncbi:glyoxalase superfamily protein [Pseudomonas putida]|uniref:Bacterial type II secretion system protein E domain-containing protein n=1 Tax=Pseudomonas putida TaxID=303 RepID=A0A8I1JHI2_PSEPU|nr:glyoxalase superfamily protein [Pseudomonas putida]MBI6882711.1 hypothetical protein [Pseudomonas putida]
MSTTHIKTRARNLQKALSELLKMPIKLSQAYELIAREEGFSNWDTAAARLSPKTPAASPRTIDDFHLPLENTWSPDGFSLERMMKEQPNLEELIRSMSSNNAGLLLISGTTGCGKTSLVEGIMNLLAKSRNQIDITEFPASFSYEKAIQCALRMSPDVLYVGEIVTVEHVRQIHDLLTKGYFVVATTYSLVCGQHQDILLSSIPAWIRPGQGFNSPPEWNQYHIHLRLERKGL